MHTHAPPSVRLAVVLCASAIVATLALVGSPAEAAPTEATPTRDSAPIREFRTAADKGWFYTLNSREAARATESNGFRQTATFGRIRTAPAPGTRAIHRLRLKSAQSYMLSVSPAEFRNPAFVDEGVFGYIDTTAKPGMRPLVRFSRDGQWRVLSDHPENVRRMQAQGFRLDGPLGFHQP